MKKTKKGLMILILVILVLVSVFFTLVTYMTDFLWFKEMGYTSVFFKQLFTQLKLGAPTFILLTALTYFYLSRLKKSYYKKVETVSGGASEKTVNASILALSAVFGGLTTATTVTRLWFQILQFQNSTDFGVADPIFNNDISFYVFKLEFLAQLNSIALNIIVSFFVVTLVFYFIMLTFRRPQMFDEVPPTEETYTEQGQEQNSNPFSQFGVFGQQFEKFTKQQHHPKKKFDSTNLNHLLNIASKQIIAMGVIFFLMLACNFFLKQFSILYSSTGIAYGAGYTDINVTLILYRALIVLSVVAAIGFAIGVSKRKLRYAVSIPALMIVLSVGGSLAAGTVQSLVVSPDEINKESKYLENNIKYTQMAYDLQDIQVKDFAASKNLTKKDILNNMGTISNIRINDFEPAEQFYNQTQSIRSYYAFNDVDVDRYMVNGEYTQTFLSAREIDESKLSNDQWLNTHLKYTHGYGVTLSRVDKVTASGQPDMMISGIPPVSDVEEIKVTRPEIYFGEKTNNYIIVNTDEQEFDYPSGESNMYSQYEGTAGIKLGFFNRCLFALKEQNLKMLVSTNIDANSKIIINRNIVDRVKKIAPFLYYDEDPYIVTVDGRLYWMMDGYTTSSYYPYSEPYMKDSSVNYIRNSVKVVVDAYNGDVNFYTVGADDPIIQTLSKIYPGLFQPLEKMPEGLKSHLRYPNALFNIQANVYKKYHMNDVKVFYQNEDLWAIANEIYGTEKKAMSPNYYVMKLPGEEKEEFISSVPYTPNGKDNMSGLLMARNDGENYGELILYRLPKDRTIYGPSQIEAQINQDTTISKEFTLWNNSGSTYSQGNMFVIPIEDSIMYVEPIYLVAASGSLPEVKKVIVVYNNRIAYEDNLSLALDKLFGEGAGAPLRSDTPITDGSEMLQHGGESLNTPPPDDTLSIEELVKKANKAYEDALAAQKSGDWAAYGNYLGDLQKYLTQMTKESTVTPPPAQEIPTEDGVAE